MQAHENNGTPYADGDVVGCGYDPTNQQVFFTHNGTLLTHCLSDVAARPYYPCVALRGLGTSVEVNFTGPFKFSTDTWSPKAADDAECQAVSCNKSA